LSVPVHQQTGKERKGKSKPEFSCPTGKFVLSKPSFYYKENPEVFKVKSEFVREVISEYDSLT